MSLTQPLAQDGARDEGVRRGPRDRSARAAGRDLFGHIAREVTGAGKETPAARAAARRRPRCAMIGQTLWNEERLQAFAKMRLG